MITASIHLRRLAAVAFVGSVALSTLGHAYAGTTISTPYSGMTRYSVSNATVNGRSVDYEIVVLDVLDNTMSFYLTPSNGAAAGETTTQTTKSFATTYSTELAINTSLYSNAGSAADVTGIAASNGNVYSPFETVGGLAALNISQDNFAETVTGVSGGTTFASSTSTPYTTIGTGSMLYRDGAVVNVGATDYRARTQVGVSRNGAQMIFFASSSGITEQEGAQILVDQFGAFDVHGLDGGGSTTMVLRTGTSTQTVIAKEGFTERAVGGNLGVQAGAYVAGIPTEMSWDADLGTAGIQQGSGTWDFVTSNWSASGTNRTWANIKNATFGAGGGASVTLSGNTAVTNMTVDGGYTFGTSGGPLFTILGTLTTTGTAATTINAQLGNSTSFTKKGAQTLNLGTGSRISMLNIDEGTVDLSGQSFSILDPITPMTMKGGIVQNGNITFEGSSSELAAPSGTTTLNVNLTATQITKTGAGTVILGGTNAWGGTLTIAEGTLRLVPTGNLPTSAVKVNGGLLDLNGAQGSITTLTMGGTNGTSSMVEIGSGALHLGGNVTYDAADNPFGAVISGTGGGVLSLNANRTVTVGDSSAAAVDLTISANMINNSSGSSTARSLVKAGAGTLLLSGSNSYSGATTINGGTVMLGNVSALGSGAGALTVNTGVLDLNGYSVGVNAFTGSASGIVTNNSGTAATLTSTSGAGNSFSGIIQDGVGVVSFTKAAAGTQTLSGSNTYSGKTSIQGGAISVSSINRVSGGSASSNLGAPVTVANGTIDLGATTVAGNLIYTGTGETTDRVINLAGTTGGGTLTQSGSGTLKFTSDLTATGTGAKTLTLQGSTAGTGEFAGSLVNSAAGATAVTKTGSGTWVLSGSNSYSGLTSITGGTLVLNRAGGTLLDTAGVTVNGGLLNVAQSDTVGAVTLTSGTISGAGALNGSGYTVNNASGTTTITAVLEGSGNLSKSGNGTLVLSGNSTRNGSTSVSAGTLTLGRAGGTLADASAVNVSSTGNLDVANSETVGVVTVSGGTISGVGTLTGSSYNLTNTSGTATLGAALAGSGTLTKSNAGSAVISGNNTYSGKTIIQRGSVSVASLNSVAGGSASSNLGAPVTVANGTIDMGASSNAGVLIYTGTGETTDRVINLAGTTGGATLDQSGTGNLKFTSALTATGAGAKALTLQGSTGGTGEIAGAIVNSSSATSLIKNGSGTWTLSGSNSYTGSTAVNAGTLLVSGVINTTSGVSITNNGSTFNYTNNSVGLTRNVTVNAGAIFLYNSSQIYSGTLVNNGGTVGGSGNFGNNVMGGGGSLNPGNSPGIMTAGGTDPGGGLDYNFEFSAANALPVWSDASASGNDVLHLTSATPFSAALSAANDNVVRLYFNVPGLSEGDVFTGGFYTDLGGAFVGSISGAAYEYYVANEFGSVTYNGTLYDLYTGPLSISVNTVGVSADFGSGSVDGFSSQFIVVPEPSGFALTALGLLVFWARRRTGPANPNRSGKFSLQG